MTNRNHLGKKYWARTWQEKAFNGTIDNSDEYGFSVHWSLIAMVSRQIGAPRSIQYPGLVLFQNSLQPNFAFLLSLRKLDQELLITLTKGLITN